jgi:hypothetical protein
VADRPVANAPASGRDQIDTVEPGEPCPGARHASTIAGLASKVPVWAPAQAKLTDSWTCGDTPVLMYGAIQVSFEPGWEGVDEKQKWSEMARDYGGSVETVLGRPAYVHPATSDAPREAVNVVVGGTLVRLLAKDGVPIKNLVQLANSIRLPADVND